LGLERSQLLVGDDADDRAPMRLVVLDRDSFSEGILSAEVIAAHGLVDENDREGGCDVRAREIPPFEDGDAQRAEVSGAHGSAVKLDGHFLFGTPLEKIIVRPMQAGEWKVVAGRGGDDARKVPQPFEELSMKALTGGGLVLRLRKRNRRGPDPRGVEAAGADMMELRRRPPRRENYGERNLRSRN
jgi:hypothetical protein